MRTNSLGPKTRAVDMEREDYSSRLWAMLCQGRQREVRHRGARPLYFGLWENGGGG